MNTIEKTKRGYHFTGSTLRNADPIPEIGEWISVVGPVIPCELGLHMSEHPMDALQYAPGSTLHMVEIRGDLQSHGDPINKWAGRERRIIATIDASGMLRSFARWCALQVVHLWDCPEIVMRWLMTGDESIKSEAESEAWSASASEAEYASRSASWSASWSASCSSWSASCSAPYASRSAALYAACSAPYAAESASASAQREKLQQMVDEAFARKELSK